MRRRAKGIRVRSNWPPAPRATQMRQRPFREWAASKNVFRCGFDLRARREQERLNGLLAAGAHTGIRRGVAASLQVAARNEAGSTPQS